MLPILIVFSRSYYLHRQNWKQKWHVYYLNQAALIHVLVTLTGKSLGALGQEYGVFTQKSFQFYML